MIACNCSNSWHFMPLVRALVQIRSDQIMPLSISDLQKIEGTDQIQLSDLPQVRPHAHYLT